MPRKPIGYLISRYAEAALSEATSAAEICTVVETAAAMAAEQFERRRRKKTERRVDCSIGCTHCCHIRVDASPVEVIALVHQLKIQSGSTGLSNIESRVEAADRRTRGLNEQAHSATHVACPLLVDNRCSAYSWRPLDCQGYESYDEGICRALRGKYDFQQVTLNAPRYGLYEQARAGLITASRKLGREDSLIELTAGLRIALSEPRSVNLWLQGHRPFAAARIA